MSGSILQKLVLGMIFLLFSLSSIYCANRLYGFSPNALVTSNISIPKNELKTNSEINVKNTTLTIENSLLKLSATRETNSAGLAIFDAKTAITIPLYSDLNITYSVYPLKLNLATDACSFYLYLFNGTHVIVLRYDIGHESLEYVYQNYIYLQYNIGNVTDSWLNGTRNVWTDLANKEVSVTKSWKITEIFLGLASYARDASGNDFPMTAVFDLDETYISYSNFTLAIVDSASIKFSWASFLGLVVSTSAFCVWSVVYLKLLKRGNQIKNKPDNG